MTASIINGKKSAEELLNLKLKVLEIKAKYSKTPCLKVLIVGDDPASSVYVSHKDKQAKILVLNLK